MTSTLAVPETEALLIGGDRSPSSGSEALDALDPSTGETIGRISKWARRLNGAGHR